METDGEVKEERGNHYTTYFRQYDPRLGRWWSNDSVVQSGESPYAAMYNNPILFFDPLGNDPGGDNPLDPGGGVSQHGGGGKKKGGGGNSGGSGGGGSSFLRDMVAQFERLGRMGMGTNSSGFQRAHQPTLQSQSRFVHTTSQRSTSLRRNAYCGTRNATTTPYSPPVEPVQLPVLSAHAPEEPRLVERVWVTLPVQKEERGISFKEMGGNVLDILYGLADGLWIGAQVFGNYVKGPSEHMYEPAMHLDGRPATREEEITGLVSFSLTLVTGFAGRAIGAGGSRLFSSMASRFSLFSRSTGTALETTVAAEAPAAMKTGAQLLDEVGAGGAASQTTTTTATENLAFGLDSGPNCIR